MSKQDTFFPLPRENAGRQAQKNLLSVKREKKSKKIPPQPPLNENHKLLWVISTIAEQRTERRPLKRKNPWNVYKTPKNLQRFALFFKQGNPTCLPRDWVHLAWGCQNSKELNLLRTQYFNNIFECLTFRRAPKIKLGLKNSQCTFYSVFDLIIHSIISGLQYFIHPREIDEKLPSKTSNFPNEF